MRAAEVIFNCAPSVQLNNVYRFGWQLLASLGFIAAQVDLLEAAGRKCPQLTCSALLDAAWLLKAARETSPRCPTRTNSN
jgi:hypothetical protein